MAGVKLERSKRRHLWVSVLYRLHRWLPLPRRLRLRLYLNLHWLFSRLSHEASHRLYRGPDHPMRADAWDFLGSHLPEMDRVLDLGCGTGELTRMIAPHVDTIVGVDHDPRVIAIAEQNGSGSSARFIVGDARAFLETSDVDFDTLLLSHVLEHLDEPTEFLRAYAPFFRYVFVEVPDFEASLQNRLRKLENLDLIYLDEDHVSEFDPDDLSSLFDRSGLRPLSSERRLGFQRYWCEVVGTGT